MGENKTAKGHWPFHTSRVFFHNVYHKPLGTSLLLSCSKFVYVIGWQAVVFGINSASIVNRKE